MSLYLFSYAIEKGVARIPPDSFEKVACRSCSRIQSGITTHTIHPMTTPEDRARYLDTCDGALADKPRLAAAFDPEWRAHFRKRILALPASAQPGYPWVYWLPMMHNMFPEMFPADLQARVERGLESLWDQMEERDRAGFIARLRDGDGSAFEELLAAAAFAAEFDPAAIKWPSAAPDERKPEFYVECDGVTWAVECRHLLDQKEIRQLNQSMLETGGSWIASIDPQIDRNRLRAAIVKKIQRAQGGGPTVILLNSYTPWLMPDEMQQVVRRILERPNEVGLDPEQLPVAIACLFMTITQGVWLCDRVCNIACIDAALRERIRRAIVNGFVQRGDGALLTELNW